MTFGGRYASSSVPSQGWAVRGAWAGGTGYQVFWRNQDGRYATWTLDAWGRAVSGQFLSVAQVRQLEAQILFDLDRNGTVG